MAIIVKIELQQGETAEPRPIGLMTIAADGATNAERANYDVALAHYGRSFGRMEEPYKRGKITNFDRRKTPYELVAAALRACKET